MPFVCMWRPEPQRPCQTRVAEVAKGFVRAERGSDDTGLTTGDGLAPRPAAILGVASISGLNRVM